jgi:predicted hydrocarbon binding protein
VSDLAKQRAVLQQAMNFAPAISCGIEELLGRSANSMTFVAGRKLGKRLTENAKKTVDVIEALDETKRVLADNQCFWNFEPFKPSSESEMIKKREDGAQEIQLVFRDCMIRQCLFRFGHPQQGSLCSMMYGFFSGALENIMGKKAVLEIKHTGENACLKKLTVSD